MKPIARVVLEPHEQRMSVEGRLLPLTAIEFKILTLLTEAAGCVFAREQLTVGLLDRDLEPYDRSLDVHILRLREKLWPHTWLLVTVGGSGYLLRSSDPVN